MRETKGDSKVVSSKQGKDTYVPDSVGKNGDGGGVTGSPRTYPKGGSVNMDAKRAVPISGKGSTYGVGGV